MTMVVENKIVQILKDKAAKHEVQYTHLYQFKKSLERNIEQAKNKMNFENEELKKLNEELEKAEKLFMSAKELLNEFMLSVNYNEKEFNQKRTEMLKLNEKLMEISEKQKLTIEQIEIFKQEIKEDKKELKDVLNEIPLNKAEKALEILSLNPIIQPVWEEYSILLDSLEKIVPVDFEIGINNEQTDFFITEIKLNNEVLKAKKTLFLERTEHQFGDNYSTDLYKTHILEIQSDSLVEFYKQIGLGIRDVYFDLINVMQEDFEMDKNITTDTFLAVKTIYIFNPNAAKEEENFIKIKTSEELFMEFGFLKEIKEENKITLSFSKYPTSYTK